MSSVSVIVCTYNRARSLRETLLSLARQQNVMNALELVVVDNNSTDQTLEVVREFRRTSPLPMHYVREPRQGVGYARNSGIQAAAGDCLLITDDDAIPEPTWVAAMVRCFEDTHADAVGGKIQPLWMAQRPAWLVDDLLGPVIRLDLGPRRMRITEPEKHFLTANLGLRRTSVRRYGAFQAALGRRGDRWVGGEDFELCERWARYGAVLMYEPGAIVQHKVEPTRLTPAFFHQWFEDIGYTQAHRLPWKWHYGLSVIPAWRWMELASTWLNARMAQRGSSESAALQAECWWLLQRSFALERLDHWTQRWGSAAAQCHFARA